MNEQTVRSVIVTGGASGIGKASVERLARAGWTVTIADRDAAAGETLAASLNDAGWRTQFVTTNVADENAVIHMVDRAVQKFGPLYGAINSAGVSQRGRKVHELTSEEWDYGNNINYRGMFLCMKYQIAAMLPAGGSIVAISSAAGINAIPDCVEYCAGKAGVTGMVRAAAVDYAGLGIRVNAILPGATLTPMVSAALAVNPALAKALPIPVGRMAQADEVAAAAVWLLSDEASYITGVSLPIDGGMTIN